MARRKAEFKKSSSILPNLTQYVEVNNKYPAVCDTCGYKKGIGQVTLSANPGDKKWASECHECASIKEAAQIHSDEEWDSQPAIRIPEDYDGDYHARP